MRLSRTPRERTLRAGGEVFFESGEGVVAEISQRRLTKDAGPENAGRVRAKLEHLCQHAPVGLCMLDARCALSIRQANRPRRGVGANLSAESQCGAQERSNRSRIVNHPYVLAA